MRIKREKIKFKSKDLPNDSDPAANRGEFCEARQTEIEVKSVAPNSGAETRSVSDTDPDRQNASEQNDSGTRSGDAIYENDADPDAPASQSASGDPLPESKTGEAQPLSSESDVPPPDEKALEQIRRADPKNKKKSSVIWKTIGLIAIFAISFYILITLSKELDDTQDHLTFGELCNKLGYLFWIVIVALFLLMLFLQALKFAYMNKISFGKLRPGLALRVNLVGKFYDNITPMSSGGQPFQMYYLHKHGVDIGNATSIPTMNYVIQMYAWQLVSLIFLTVNGGVLETAAAREATMIITMCWIGWSINMIAPLLLLSVAFAPKFARAMSRGIVKIGKKLRIVKDYDATLKKIYDSIDSYRKELLFMGKKIGHIICLMLISAVEFLVLISIPMVLAYFIADTAFTFQNWANLSTLYLYTLYAVTFLPTPGASGFAETMSTLAFAGVATAGTLIWLLIFMRFFTYYIFIILGLLVTLYDNVSGGIRYRRAKKARNADPETESESAHSDSTSPPSEKPDDADCALSPKE